MPSSALFFLLLQLLCAAAKPQLREVESADYPKPTELFYPQKLDHFNPADRRTWPHRYLINNDSWDGRGHLANGCPGPVLLYTGNEGPIDDFWAISGFVVQTLASKLGGLVVFPEERYYGKSLPFGAASLQAENAHYLTTAQVLEDYVELVAHLKATIPKAHNCPVVAFGGSYGGTLTALLRAAHPATVIGGLAASSELGYYDPAGMIAHGVDEFAWEDVVIDTWKSARPGCLDAIRETIQAIDNANESYIVDKFNVCEPRALGPGPKSTLFAYVLEGMPQGDYPSLGFPVTKACDALLTAAGGCTADKPPWKAGFSCADAAHCCAGQNGVPPPGNTEVCGTLDCKNDGSVCAGLWMKDNCCKTCGAGGGDDGGAQQLMHDAGRAEALINAASVIVKSFSDDSNSCIAYNVGGPGNTPGDGPDGTGFGYQSCTECLHQFSARTLRNYTFSLDKSTALCGSLYNHTVRPDLNALAREFGGGYALAEGTAGVSHLIWSQGTLDPWHGWWKNIKAAPSNLEVYHILMEGSAHHTDLRSPSPADPTSVTKARELEETIIRKWIAEATSVEATSVEVVV